MINLEKYKVVVSFDVGHLRGRWYLELKYNSPIDNKSLSELYWAKEGVSELDFLKQYLDKSKNINWVKAQVHNLLNKYINKTNENNEISSLIEQIKNNTIEVEVELQINR